MNGSQEIKEIASQEEDSNHNSRIPLSAYKFQSRQQDFNTQPSKPLQSSFDFSQRFRDEERRAEAISHSLTVGSRQGNPLNNSISGGRESSLLAAMRSPRGQNRVHGESQFSPNGSRSGQHSQKEEDQNLQKRRSQMRRMSTGVNFFLGSMKFKNIEDAVEEKPVRSKANSRLQKISQDSNSSESSDTETRREISESSSEKNVIAVPMKDLNLNQLSHTLTGQIDELDPEKVKQQDNELVRPGNLEGRSFIDVYSPRGIHRVRVFNSVNRKIRIVSKFIKRMELEHIENQIDFLNVVPDFGYQTIYKEEVGLRGWDLLRDFVQNSSRYERLENYIQMRQVQQQEKLRSQVPKSKYNKNDLFADRRATRLIQTDIAAQIQNKIYETLKNSKKAPTKIKAQAAASEKRNKLRQDLQELYDMQAKAMEFLQRFKQVHERQERLILRKEEDSDSSVKLTRQHTLNSKRLGETPRTNSHNAVTPSQFQRSSIQHFEARLSPKNQNKLARKTTIFQKNVLDDFTAFGKFKGKSLAPNEDGQRLSSFANSPKVQSKQTNGRQTKEGQGFSELILKTIAEDDQHSKIVAKFSSAISMIKQTPPGSGGASPVRRSQVISKQDSTIEEVQSRPLSDETRSLCTEILSSEEEPHQPAKAVKTEPEVGLSKREIELFNLLKQAYQSTIKQLFSLCAKSCKPQGTLVDQGHAKKKVKISIGKLGKRPTGQSIETMNKNIMELRKDKINIGSLLRVVAQQKYETLSSSLKEVERAEEREPGLRRYHYHFEKKREESLLRQKKKETKPVRQLNSDLKVIKPVQRKQVFSQQSTVRPKKLVQQSLGPEEIKQIQNPPVVCSPPPAVQQIQAETQKKRELVTSPKVEKNKFMAYRSSMFRDTFSPQIKSRPQTKNGDNRGTFGLSLDLDQSFNHDPILKHLPTSPDSTKKRMASFAVQQIYHRPSQKSQGATNLSRILKQSINSFQDPRPSGRADPETSIPSAQMTTMMSPQQQFSNIASDMIRYPPKKAATTLKSPAADSSPIQSKQGTRSSVSNRYGRSKDHLLRDLILNKRQGQFLHHNWHYIKLRKKQMIRSRFDSICTPIDGNRILTTDNFEGTLATARPEDHAMHLQLPEIRQSANSSILNKRELASSIDPSNFFTDPGFEMPPYSNDAQGREAQMTISQRLFAQNPEVQKAFQRSTETMGDATTKVSGAQ